MTVSDELTRLRLEWGKSGIPRDAYVQIGEVLGRHIGKQGPAPRRKLTAAELERCRRCDLPRICHERLSNGCPGVFSDSPAPTPAKKEIWEE